MADDPSRVWAKTELYALEKCQVAYHSPLHMNWARNFTAIRSKSFDVSPTIELRLSPIWADNVQIEFLNDLQVGGVAANLYKQIGGLYTTSNLLVIYKQL